jgi:hypothetical protein
MENLKVTIMLDVAEKSLLKRSKQPLQEGEGASCGLKAAATPNLKAVVMLELGLVN